jgi:hypothetical protein
MRVPERKLKKLDRICEFKILRASIKLFTFLLGQINILLIPRYDSPYQQYRPNQKRSESVNDAI